MHRLFPWHLAAGQANANQIVRNCWFGTQIVGVEECGTHSCTLDDKQITYLQNPTTNVTTGLLSTQISRQTSPAASPEERTAP
jgi:hypothetical protein